MIWMFFLFGLGSLTGQILLLREILVVFHGTEISIGIFYSAWLLGIGIGASLGAVMVRRSERDFQAIFLHCLAGLGFSLLFQIVLIRMVPGVFEASPAELAPLRGILVAVPMGTVVSAFLTGFLFPTGCRSVRDANGRLIARVYVFEALGSLFGGLILTFYLARLLSPLTIASAVALALAAGAIVYSLRLNRWDCLWSALPLLAVALVVLSPVGSRLTDWSTRVRWDALHPGLKLLESRPTPYQEVEIAALGKQVSLFGNSKIVSSFPDPHTADRLAAVIMAQNPDAKRFLLIGGGIGSLPVSLLKYPLLKLDIVEPDPWAFQIAQKHLPPKEADALKDSRVGVIFQDGRFYMNRVGESVYDVIIDMVPDPVSSFWNRYYTLEFFQSAFRALTRKGIFFTQVTSAENFWGSETASYAGSVYQTLKMVFPSVKATPGDETMFFASPDSDLLSLHPEVLKYRYEQLSEMFFDPAGFATILPPERTAFVQQELDRSPRLINTDASPISSSLAMILWGRFSGSERMELLNTIRRGGLTVYLIPILFFLVARITFRARWGPREGRENRFQALLAMTAVGATAMGMQIVLIYAYQSLFGYVFERIGLFAAIFMTGLVGGGHGSGVALGRIRNKEAAILLTLGLLAVMCLTLPAMLKQLADREPWQIEAALFTLVFLSGILTGAAFPFVASRYLEMVANPGQASGWTDAADHYGAAVGALISGTLLVPLLGTTEACIVLALLVLVPTILMAEEAALIRIEPVLEKYRTRHRVSFPFVRTSWLLFFAVAGAMMWNLLIGSPGRTFTTKFADEVLEKVSGSSAFTFNENPFPHYVGRSGGNPGSTFSFSTAPIVGDVRGYGGPINLLVSVTDEGIIGGVSIVESRETPSYLTGMDGWLARLRGRSILKPLGDEVDALTGATITCVAIQQILSKTGQRIGGPLLGVQAEVESPRSTSFWASSFKDVRLWAVLLLLSLFIVAFYSRVRWIRLCCLVAAFIIVGLYLNAPFTSLEAARLLQGDIPATETPWRITLFVAIITISCLWGQAFCGFLCPFGALQEFISLKALRRRASPDIEQAGRYLKFVVLAVLLCLFLLTDDIVWFSFSPLQHFFRGEMGWWVLALSMLVLAASLFYFRFWCRYLCPAGAFLALFNKLSLLRRWSPRPAPSRCDLGVTLATDVDCIRCHRCLFEDAAAAKDK